MTLWPPPCSRRPGQAAAGAFRQRRASGSCAAAVTVAAAPPTSCVVPGPRVPCPASARLPGSPPHCSDMLGGRAPRQPRPEAGRGPRRLCLGLSRTLGHDLDCRVPCPLSGSQVEDVMQPTRVPHWGATPGDIPSGAAWGPGLRIGTENELPGRIQAAAAAGPRGHAELPTEVGCAQEAPRAGSGRSHRACVNACLCAFEAASSPKR